MASDVSRSAPMAVYPVPKSQAQKSPGATGLLQQQQQQTCTERIMHTDHHSINTTPAAPRFHVAQNVARTMSSAELLEIINAARAEAGEPEIYNLHLYLVR